jgi:hypothetical protein
MPVRAGGGIAAGADEQADGEFLAIEPVGVITQPVRHVLDHRPEQSRALDNIPLVLGAEGFRRSGWFCPEPRP